MRRGHSGIGGWRNEIPRQFRPRGTGGPHFRQPRPVSLLNLPRYAPPGPRPHRGPQPFDTRGSNDNHEDQDYHDRNNYRINRQNVHHRHMERGPPPQEDRYYQQSQHSRVNVHISPYKDNPRHFDSPVLMNSMGDIDQRQIYNPHQNQESYGMPKSHANPWKNPQYERKKDYDERTVHNRPYKHHDMMEPRDKLPVADYSGHRPPSSDYYGATSTPKTDNAFSCSVDDTVDIVRKRLLSRSDPQYEDNRSIETSQSTSPEAGLLASSYRDPEQPPRRRVAQRRSKSENCDKMKNKIVHQLFKMDKDKMHRLLDNPSSSTKFEYAISSLITESQNTYNRHLRSMAEKSLTGSSTEFIHDDNNTIYEDTFMKQMQCILDPQDTVLLEDIKPLVLAELSKVLQLEDHDQRIQTVERQGVYSVERDPPDYEYNYEEYLQNAAAYEEPIHSRYVEDQSLENKELEHRDLYNQTEINEEDYKEKPLFERRKPPPTLPDPHPQKDYSNERRLSAENRRNSRKSADKIIEETYHADETPIGLFDANVEQLSEDEDPFAELDNQYHVAVDPSFIETEDPSTPPQSNSNTAATTPIKSTPSKLISVKKDLKEKYLTTPPKLWNIKTEIDNQILSIAQSPLKLASIDVHTSNKNKDHENKHSTKHVKKEIKDVESLDNVEVTASERISMESVKSIDKDKVVKSEHLPEPQAIEVDDVKHIESQNTQIKSPVASNSRKRAADQRPSHRKEKRKKDDTCQIESNKQILNKNIIINVNDCAGKASEKCDTAKSIFNLYFSKNDASKNISSDNKNTNAPDKTYSDKYVKRKESSKKPKDKDNSNKKRSPSTSSHSMLSPKDSDTSTESSNKSDSKIKLKSIDMFMEQPKKTSLHQTHRKSSTSTNVTQTTAPTTPTTPITEETKFKQLPIVTISRTKTKRHVGTQVIKRYSNKDTQTIPKRLSVKTTQTDPVKFAKSGKKSADAFERMKEIDMEIQVLLQEKFKLYNSIESKDPSQGTMTGLGMTVLNVTELQKGDDNMDDPLSEDAIVDEFTSIPEDELEQIALESIAEEPTESSRFPKRVRRQKVLEIERRTTESPTSTKKSGRKTKTPNISLLEQIISDERPIEDIISLDDLETSPVKSKAKLKAKPKKKKKQIKKLITESPVENVDGFVIKDCFVSLTRIDISSYLEDDKILEADSKEYDNVTEVPLEKIELEITCSTEKLDEDTVQVHMTQTEIVEEVLNDLQFDMLDVSEDIVIGDNCEVKSSEDKDAEPLGIINEEIILDNSQSSCEDAFNSEAEQDVCRMYDYSADENLRRDSMVVTGNADAVLAIECINNDFIAACLDGNVYHFSGDGQLLNTLRGSNLAVTCLTIVQEKYGTTVYTGSLDSRIRYFDLETGLEKGPECNVLSPIQTMDRAWDTVFVGTRTGFVLQFECKNNMLIPVSTVKFAEQSILALRALKEGPRKVLLVAARSENVTVKDAQTGLLLRTLHGPKMTVYTLLYEDGKVYCGTSSHQIHVFDYTSGGHVGTHEGGKGAVCLRASGGLVFAGCYDGCVYVYREGARRPFAQLRGPSLMLLSLAIRGTKIIAGYKDRSLYIWKIPLNILQEMIL